MLLGGQRVLPEALQASGFSFALPDLEAALRHTLGR
jgi:NAD dependent epimerase/dehydratase family enzyme